VNWLSAIIAESKRQDFRSLNHYLRWFAAMRRMKMRYLDGD
jgi:hypothetical protein